MMNQTRNKIFTFIILSLLPYFSWAGPEELLEKFEIENAYRSASGGHLIIKFKDFPELQNQPFFYGTKNELRQLVGRELKYIQHGYATNQNVFKFPRIAQKDADIILGDQRRPAELVCDTSKRIKFWQLEDDDDIEEAIQNGTTMFVSLPRVESLKIYFENNETLDHWIHVYEPYFYITEKNKNTYGYRLFGGAGIELNEMKLKDMELYRDGGTKKFTTTDDSRFTVPHSSKEPITFTQGDSTKTYISQDTKKRTEIAADGTVRNVTYQNELILTGYPFQTQTPCDWVK